MKYSADVRFVIKRFWDEKKVFHFACISGDMATLKKMLKRDLDIIWCSKTVVSGFVGAASHHRFRVAKWLNRFSKLININCNDSTLFISDIVTLQFYAKHCGFANSVWITFLSEALSQKNQNCVDFILNAIKFEMEDFNVINNPSIFKFYIDAHLKLTGPKNVSFEKLCENGYWDLALHFWKSGFVNLKTLENLFVDVTFYGNVDILINIWKFGVLERKHVLAALVNAICANNLESVTYLFRLESFTPREILDALPKDRKFPPRILEFLLIHNTFQEEDVVAHIHQCPYFFGVLDFIKCPKLLPIIFKTNLFERNVWCDVTLISFACQKNLFDSVLFLNENNLFTKSQIEWNVCSICELRLQLRKKRKCLQ